MIRFQNSSVGIIVIVLVLFAGYMIWVYVPKGIEMVQEAMNPAVETWRPEPKVEWVPVKGEDKG